MPPCVATLLFVHTYKERKMEKSIFQVFGIFLAFSFAITISAEARADSLYDVYVESVARPSGFDEFVTANTDIFDGAFLACMQTRFSELWQTAEAQIDVCNQHANPDWRRQCLNSNPEANVALWLQSLNARLTENTPWCNTMSGYMQCAGELMMDSMGGHGAWERIAIEGLAKDGVLVKPLITCH